MVVANAVSPTHCPVQEVFDAVRLVCAKRPVNSKTVTEMRREVVIIGF